MKKKFIGVAVLCAAFALGLTVPMEAEAKGKTDYIIKEGIYISDIDVSGMNEKQAIAEVEEYVDTLLATEITLVAAREKEVVVTAADFGMTWSNREIVEEAARLGQTGNVIERYKAMKDLQETNINFVLEFTYDKELINQIINEQCVKYDRAAVNMSLRRENAAFTIVEGKEGYALNVEASADLLHNFLANEWTYDVTTIPLVVETLLPKGSVEELSKVTDVLSSFSTSFASSGAARSANVTNGCVLINGTTLYPGEEFSTYAHVAPYTVANGYHMAGSYVNGKVVDSLGGGICQVSTTLYNAVLLAELDVTERHNHSMIVTYVAPSADAAVAESAGKDFRFVNNTDAPIYIEGFVVDKNLTFNIYGKETRKAGRTVSYESAILETIQPSAEVIYTDNTKPIGYVEKQSAHVGYKAQLWKVVRQDGAEISRTLVNSSSYKMTPRMATFGVATDNGDAYNEIMAAIGTNNIDHTINVVAAITSVSHSGSENASE